MPLTRALQECGHYVVTSLDEAHAAAQLDVARHDAALICSSTAGLDGGELLPWISAHHPELAVVMLSATEDARAAVRAMKNGAQDYILTPCSLAEVEQAIVVAIDQKRALLLRPSGSQQSVEMLARENADPTNIRRRLHDASEDTLEALAAALDARERETYSHSKRVSQYSVDLARKFGVSGDELDTIRRGSLLHDIGKIGIPDRILLKPGLLTAEEWVEMREHPRIGAWIMSGVESLQPAVSLVMAHHERFDGTGYPLGLQGRNIPVGARVFAIADTMDAILSDRPYRMGRSYEQVRAEVSKHSSTQFDPEIATCFLSMEPEDWTWTGAGPKPAVGTGCL